MRTTLDLPDDLARRIKVRAAERNMKLKETVAELLELGLAATPQRVARQRLPRPVTLRKHGPLRTPDIETAIAEGRS